MQQPDFKKKLQWLPVPELPLGSSKMEEVQGRCDYVHRPWFYMSRLCLKAYRHDYDIRPKLSKKVFFPQKTKGTLKKKHLRQWTAYFKGFFSMRSFF
jgi:hypothetical protein